ncbi:MAG: T9SS type A sorting domain-containing protein [Bacteroidales bacterium]|nr:T9SS type A sorting domain-containing protein [Bacteroidales bacterium]
MKKIQLFTLLFLMVVQPYHGYAAILHVPATYVSIQAGIDASSNGDTVLVDPGIYLEHLNLNGKNIVLCSWYITTGNSAYIASTVIDGGNTGRVVTIDQWETSSCRIVGFTIQHGNSSSEPPPSYGGGVSILNASPQVLNCIIRNNYAPGYGGGLSVYGPDSYAKVMNCSILDNTSDSFGGGVFMGDCNPEAEIISCVISGNTITCACSWNGGGGGVNLYHTGKLVNCLITNNSAPNSPAGGGGIHCDWGDYYGSQGIFVTGCTITNNTALDNGGVSFVISGGEFRNCIIWGNTNSYGSTSNYDGSSFINCCSDPLPPGTGNISSDPDFINPASVNFRLSGGSPCIDAGNNTFNSQPHDLDGNPRIVDVIDMGAYEKSSESGTTIQIGSGTEISEIFPIFSCFGYNYSQQIYLGSEIISGGGAAGFISKIRFFFSGGASAYSLWNNWTVYLGNTTKSSFDNITDWIPVSSMTQVFSGIIPDPVDSAWVEITLPAPFYYSGDNIVVAVDENSDNWECTAQWGSFDAGSPRGLLFFDDGFNPDPASPPEANVVPENSIAKVQFVLMNSFGFLEGVVTEMPLCTDPVEGATITSGTYSTTANASGFYQLTLPIGTYFDVTAHHGTVSQTISPVFITAGNTTTQDFCLAPYYAPPVGLQASTYGPVLNNVHLSWLEPGSVPDQWIHWDNGTYWGALGYDAPAVFNVASRWPVPDIAPYAGGYLKKIRFMTGGAVCTYTIKVWKGANAATLLHSQVVSNIVPQVWNEITLSIPVAIDGTDEFWFGYEANQTAGYPAGLDPGPAVAGKGDMIDAGYGWFSMKNAWNFDFNWSLQGFISGNPSAPQQLIPLTRSNTQKSIVNNPVPFPGKPKVLQRDQFMAEKFPAGCIVPSVTTDTDEIGSRPARMFQKSLATLTGYNVYRDNVKIGDNITDLFYDDLLLPKAGYDFEVSAQYDLGESERIGPVHIDIYTCFPPTNLTVSNTTLTTETADLSWTPSTISTNLQWILEWGPSGFLHGYGTIVLPSGTPGHSIWGLSPGTEYDFYVRTYCTQGDTSIWVKKTFRTHYFGCPVNAIAEAELCGDTTNNGCNLSIPAFENMVCGDTICGSLWFNGSHVDSDWYSFTLTEINEVTLTGNAEFDYILGIAYSPCPSSGFITSYYITAGYSYPIIVPLDPGTYYAYIAPLYNQMVVCDSLSRYWATLICSTCITPVDLNVSNITVNSANLFWTSSAELWNIEYGPVGFVQGTGTMITGTDQNPYPLTGLTSGYAYSYYVQSDCGGDYSYWAGPYTFYIPCPSSSLPYSEDFTSQITGTSPQCWQVRGDGAHGNWIVDISNNAGGVYPELAFVPYNVYFYGSSYLTSPVINTTGHSELNLSLKQLIFSNSEGVSCEIWTTSDGGLNWNTVWSFAQIGILGPETTELTISTPDVGSATLQFAFAVNGYSWDIGNWQIDDIELTATGPPLTTTVQNVTVLNGQTTCFNATQTITVAGGGTTFTVENGGIVTMIAGINILYLPGAWVKPGGYMLGKIAPGGPYCGAKSSSLVSADAGGEEGKPVIVDKPNLKIYPNPTNGNFRMEFSGLQQGEAIRVDIYGMRGETVMSEMVKGETAHEFSLSDKPAGIYFIKVIAGEKFMTSKLVKAK